MRDFTVEGLSETSWSNECRVAVVEVSDLLLDSIG